VVSEHFGCLLTWGDKFIEILGANIFFWPLEDFDITEKQLFGVT